MTDYQLDELYTTDAMICGACLRGIGEGCNTPGCVFIRSKSLSVHGTSQLKSGYDGRLLIARIGGGKC